MNQRIKQLAEQVYGTQATEQERKFAELIVQDCISIVESTPTHCAFTSYQYPIVTCTISKSVEILKTEFGLPL